MKITKENLITFNAYILKAMEIVNIDDHRAYIVKEGKAKDIEKRLRWDYANIANKLYRQENEEDFICDILYKSNDLNDEHIDSALKHIFKDKL